MVLSFAWMVHTYYFQPDGVKSWFVHTFFHHYCLFKPLLAIVIHLSLFSSRRFPILPPFWKWFELIWIWPKEKVSHSSNESIIRVNNWRDRIQAFEFILHPMDVNNRHDKMTVGFKIQFIYYQIPCGGGRPVVSTSEWPVAIHKVETGFDLGTRYHMSAIVVNQYMYWNKVLSFAASLFIRYVDCGQ